MRTSWAVLVAGLGLLLSAGPALAHHGFGAEYDTKQPIKLTGTVTKVDWRNPHAWFYMDVKDDSGKITNWGFEMVSPNSLMRAGWTRNSLKIGDAVTVEASRAKDGANIASLKTVTMNGTGQQLFQPSPER